MRFACQRAVIIITKTNDKLLPRVKGTVALTERCKSKSWRVKVSVKM